MFWVLQSNLYNERGYKSFIDAIDSFGIDYKIIKPVPMTDKFVDKDFDSFKYDFNDAVEPKIDDSGKVIVFGGTTLNRISQSRSWYPGTYLNDNFDFNVWRKGFGRKNILNGDAIVDSVKNISNYGNLGDILFVRPTEDTKSFAGALMSVQEFFCWKNEISKIDNDGFNLLNKDTEIVVAGIKKIYTEYRLFVVDGKIVASSLYKRGSKVIADSNVDDHIIDFGKKMIDTWQPAKAFVLDVCETEHGMKIVEINNINSAGFYACDVHAIVEAILRMEE